MATQTTRPKANLPVNYQEQLAREAAEIGKRLAAPSGDRIRFNGSTSIITPDGNEGESLEVVIIEFMSSNMYYEGAFDRGNPQPPACFAIGPEPSMLVPPTNVPDRQAETCSVCPQNQFGSAGKGKACKNTRLVAVTPLVQDGNEPPVWIMSIPPTSIKAFDAYVASLASKHKTAPVGVVSEISLDRTSSYAAPRFKVIRPLEDEEFGSYMERREEASNRLLTPPDTSQYVGAPKNGRNAPAQVRRGAR